MRFSVEAAHHHALVCAASLAALGLGLALQSFSALALDSKLVASGLNQPLFVTAPQGDARLFIVEKGGLIKVQRNGVVQPTPLLNISGSVNTDGERGLLGMAFDPNFANPDPMAPGYRTFYVNYIDRTSLSTVVASYQISASDANRADAASAKTLITVLQPTGRSNHKAGWIGFRPGEANHLYIATGDGGSGNDPDRLAQNLNSNLGKMLRIDVRGDAFLTDPNRNYSIPVTNPFAGAIAGNDEIWAYGLRNPYRNSFDRLTGDLYIGDVGQGAREEIDFERADFLEGANYGWRAREGKFDNPGVSDAAPTGAIDPLYDYGHGDQFDPPFEAFEGRSVTGGYVYRGSVAELQGRYIFGDYISGQIWSFKVDRNTGQIVAGSLQDLTATFANAVSPINEISSFGEDGFGNLYVVDLGGQVFALVPEPSAWAMLLAGLVVLGLLVRRRNGTSVPHALG